jgi:cell division protein FtsQ
MNKIMKRSFKYFLTYGLLGILLSALIGFTMIKSADVKMTSVVVDINNETGIYFVDQEEIHALLFDLDSGLSFTTKISDVNFKKIEQSVEQHAFVKRAEAFHDLKGNIGIQVTQAIPIARIFRVGRDDFYIDQEGMLLPINTKYTARVPLIEVEDELPWLSELSENEVGQELLELLNKINSDAFWKAQIAHIYLKSNGEVEMLPQVTKQRILFGSLKDQEDKFEKLMLFYKKILPNKGWNTYSTVNLKYKNQIVCQ